MIRCVLVGLGLAACASSGGSGDSSAGKAEGAKSQAVLAREVQTLPGSVVSFEAVLVPGVRENGGALWVGVTEVPWELYDTYVYALAEGDDYDASLDNDIDAASRPSKPYVSVDRGFGHDGYPALSMTRKGAEGFVQWLAGWTGRAWRLPTEAEWEFLARGGGSGEWSFAGGAKQLDAHAWYAENSGHRSHPVRSRASTAFGLHDVHGNVAEWCVNVDGTAAVRGGAFLDADVRASARREPSPNWNASDPQIPKGTWWLADASFVGLRVVADPDQ